MVAWGGCEWWLGVDACEWWLGVDVSGGLGWMGLEWPAGVNAAGCLTMCVMTMCSATGLMAGQVRMAGECVT